MRMSATFRAAQRAPVLHLAKSAVATVGAWIVAGWLIPGPPPVFAAIAALLVVQPSVNQSFVKAVERSIGVIAGVVIASVLGILLGSDAWVVLVATVVALVVAWVARVTPGTSNQVAISALLVLTLGTATPNYALDRVLETIIGAVIGILVNLALVPPVLVAPAHAAVDRLGGELAASMERLADAVTTPPAAAHVQGLLIEARLLRPMKDAADQAIGAASDSLALNPRSRRHRDELRDVQTALDRLTPVITQTIGLTRAFADLYDPTLADEPVAAAIAEQLRRAAHDVRVTVRGTDAAAAASELVPALTTPLMIRTPSDRHWVLIGSMLEDLRRIHAALTDPQP
ncbi:FUSC family protein [Microbacterium hominis]|uniref:FUSC family protein n=1 Tax=Microbacterium hominis TaxID=162426 RepID=A0A7D4TGU2_9MICO|nr:FUSC family protein [Microbacterium hominis]QKJ19621.1 FUSC family protein [Microbacterium hominis]